MSNVVATAKDGTENYGMRNRFGTYTLLVDRSTFEGAPILFLVIRGSRF